MDPAVSDSVNNDRFGGRENGPREVFQMEEFANFSEKSLKSLDEFEVPVTFPSKLFRSEMSDGDDEHSSSDESQIEYHKKVTRTRSPNSQFSKDKRRKQKQQDIIIGAGDAVSDDNFGFPDPNANKVRRTDVIFATIVLLVSLGDFVTDFGLIWWHYSDDLKWVSAFTCMIMICGAGVMLSHFSHVDMDTLNRLFINANRVKVITNCLPFMGSVISSYQCVRTAFRATRERIFCLQYFAVEDFSLNLLRIQSFFQSAPQAALQLVVLMETIHEVKPAKAVFSIIGVMLSLAVMTIANLPYRNQNYETIDTPSAYSPSKRLFIACRMFSSFGSRAMAIAYLLMALRCLFGFDAPTFPSVLLGVVIIVFPRLVFTFADYVRQLIKARRSRNPQEFRGLSCCGTFIGYFATIFIPMSDPVWIFWYLWAETALYVLLGNVVGWSANCLSNLTNALYTGIFIITFIIVPIFIPLARATARKKQLKRMETFFEEKRNESAESPSSSMDLP